MLMLDADICSFVIRRRPESLLPHFEQHADELCVSVITAAELRFGAEKVGRPKLAQTVETFLERLSILDWNNAVTFHCAKLRSDLEKAGTPIGNMDLLIAAHAISEGAALVTNNKKHFSQVEGLPLKNGSRTISRSKGRLMKARSKRNIGREILEGIRQLKRGEVGRVISAPKASSIRKEKTKQNREFTWVSRGVEARGCRG